MKILFVCLGNICRSPMAESVMTHLLRQRGISHIQVASAATSREEEGNPVHPGTRNKLARMGIPLVPHRARVMTEDDARKYDLLIGMDRSNLSSMARIAGSSQKIHSLLEWTGRSGDIADPWYTGNFDQTFDDILEGCTALLDALSKD